VPPNSELDESFGCRPHRADSLDNDGLWKGDMAVGRARPVMAGDRDAFDLRAAQVNAGADAHASII
jgi:hypothetical protein